MRPKWSLPALDKTTAHEHEGMATCTRVCKIQLQQAVDKSKAADLKLMVGGEWVASAHWSVLIASSPVFAAMFMNQTMERETGEIKLDDVTAEGLLLFLEFLYLGMLHSLL